MTKTKTFNSGVQLVVSETNSPMTVFGLLVKVGSFHEEAEFEGASHFIEHLMFKSTKNRTVEQIAEEQEFWGSEINAFTSKTHTVYHFKCLTENFEKSLEIYADMLQNGLLDEREVNSEREVVLEEIKRAHDSVSRILYYETDKAIYSGTRLEHKILGNEENIKNISIEKIKEFINKFYTADNIIFSISGGVSFNDAEKLIKKYFPKYFEGNSKPKELDTTPFNICIKQKHITHEKDDKQVNVMVSIKGNSMYDEDMFHQKIYAKILGSGMSSRLFQTLREKMGLAYSVSAISDDDFNSGTVKLSIGTSKDKLTKALQGMRAIIEDMAINGVTEYEVQKAKNKLISKLIYDEETNISLMKKNLLQLYFRGRLLTHEEIIERINKVTIQDINNFAKRISNEKEFFVCAVGKEIDCNDLKVFGKE